MYIIALIKINFIYIYIYIHIHIYMYVCMYVYVYMYVHCKILFFPILSKAFLHRNYVFNIKNSFIYIYIYYDRRKRENCIR